MEAFLLEARIPSSSFLEGGPQMEISNGEVAPPYGGMAWTLHLSGGGHSFSLLITSLILRAPHL